MSADDMPFTFDYALGAARNLIEDAMRDGHPLASATFNAPSKHAPNAGTQEHPWSVSAIGPSSVDLMIVGQDLGNEAVSDDTIEHAAGTLLSDILAAIGLARSEVFVLDMVQSSNAPKDATQTIEFDDVQSCVKEHIKRVQPAVILCMGQVALEVMWGKKTSLVQRRGQFGAFENVPLMPTLSPAFLLQQPAYKKDVWMDMKKLHARLTKVTGKQFAMKGKS